MDQDPRRNRILAALDAPTLDALERKLDPIELHTKDLLYEVDQPIRYVYFVLSGVISVVTPVENGGFVEVATIGNEGMAGLAAFLGAEKATLRSFVQVPGSSMRMRAEEFKGLPGNGMLATMLHRYTQAFITQIAQTSGCNRIHPIGERCARWLLITHDRVEGETFPLTQDFLAQMLGVRRAAVNEVAGALQNSGLITYQRGVITVLDRAGLEEVACECYETVEREFERLLGGRTRTRNQTYSNPATR